MFLANTLKYRGEGGLIFTCALTRQLKLKNFKTNFLAYL